MFSSTILRQILKTSCYCTSIRRGEISHERRLTERLRVQVRHARPVPAVPFRGEELCADAEARNLQLVRLRVVAQDCGHDGLLPEERLERLVVFLAFMAPVSWGKTCVTGTEMLPNMLTPNQKSQ